MSAQGLIGEDPCRTDLDQIAAEFALQNTAFMSAEINQMMREECAEIPAACIIPVIAQTPVALYAAVHFVIDKGPEILILKGPLCSPITAVTMAGHDHHILQMTFPALITDRTIVRMIDHHQFRNGFPELNGVRIFYGNTRAVFRSSHAGHDNAPLCILFIPEFLDGTLPAGSHRMHGRMPAEIGKIEPELQTGLEQIQTGSDRVRLIFDKNSRHDL
jgi:hypothetical protein